MKNFFKLITYLKPYKTDAILAPVFMICEVIILLALPTIMERIIDVGLATNDFQYVLLYSLLMIVLAFVGLLFGILLNFFSTKASISMASDLRSDTFSKVQRMSFTNLDKTETGKIITRLTNDILQIQNATNMSLRLLFRAPVMLIGSIIMSIVFMPKLSIIVLVMLPLAVLLIFILFKFAAPLFTKMQERIDDVNTITEENLSGVRVVKAFVKEDFEINRFSIANTNLMNTVTRASRIIFIAFPFLFLLVNLGITATLYIGSEMNLPVGSISAFINYISFILFSIMMLTAIIIMIPRADASAKRIFEILNTRSEIQEITNPIKKDLKGKIEFRNVSFAYQDDVCVLNNINLTINPGEKIGIIGSTGSGKSTLVNLIPRFYDVTSGDVFLDDINVKEYSLEHLRNQISEVMQKTYLFAGTIKGNITYATPLATDDEMIEASKVAQAAEFIQSLENQYDQEVSQRGTNLSGGQKQRISIARAIIKKPKILIFDDCTSAVDMITEAKIQEGLKTYMQDTTSIIVAQRIRSIKNADKIIVVHNGEINAIGTHDELLQTNEIYREINQSQGGGDDIE